MFTYVIIAFAVFQSARCEDPIVVTSNGQIRGSRASDGNYNKFLGIPFASIDPSNPFGDALPNPNFDGIFDATQDAPPCVQIDRNDMIQGVNDCLTLNVYVPIAASSNNKLSVMVYIFGGGFSQGTVSEASFGAEYIVKNDVILVTMNYRLGPYGFMCLEIPGVPGNTGLKDQQRGLRWVHDNILAFGGDPDQVTIFGWSAGGGSCEFHVINPTSSQYFQRAILQSAGVFTDGIIEESNPSGALKLAKNLGFYTDKVDETIPFLSNVSTAELLRASKRLNLDYKPCIEKSFQGIEGFILTNPQKLIKSGMVREIPLIIGHTSSESFKENIQPEDNTYIFDRLNKRFKFPNDIKLDTAVNVVKDFYIDHEGLLNSKDVKAMADFFSDFVCNFGQERSVTYHLSNSNNRIYQYVFGYFGSHNQYNSSTFGVRHGGELPYLFKMAGSKNTQEDLVFINKFTKMWTNFAKYGDPTPEMSELLPVRWPVVSRDSRDYLWIVSEPRVKQKPFHKRMAFWDLFFVAFGKYFWLA